MTLLSHMRRKKDVLVKKKKKKLEEKQGGDRETQGVHIDLHLIFVYVCLFVCVWF